MVLATVTVTILTIIIKMVINAVFTFAVITISILLMSAFPSQKCKGLRFWAGIFGS